MAKATTQFICQNCGFASTKWHGRCPQCEQWETMVETAIARPVPIGSLGNKASASALSRGRRPALVHPTPLHQVSGSGHERLQVPMEEFNRVVGGGLVRGCTERLMRWAKPAQVPVLIVGHVTEEGSLAGPRVLEHMVDAVLYLEGDRFGQYRILRAVKNRFGSTNEVGIFEMSDSGMREIRNPSEAFLQERVDSAAGSTVAVTLEGTRPLLVEVQALTSTTANPMPRRTANGVEINRLQMLAAVLQKRVGLPLGGQDIYVNVVGGLKVD